jgi:hypothetical protein
MAKAKKTTEETPAEEKPAKKPAAKKPAAKKKSAPAAPAGMPLIDTGVAAKVAASLVAKKVQTETTGQTKKPSATFQQLKNNLTKPPSAVVGNLLGDIQGKRAAGPQGFAKQVGHAQTFGADVNRAGVPRRTGG